MTLLFRRFFYSICRTGNADLCEFLLSLGAEVRVGPASGLSPLHITCLVGNLKCVDIILKVPRACFVVLGHCLGTVFILNLIELF